MKNLALLLLIPLFFLVNKTTIAQDCLTIWSSNDIVQSGDTARLDIRVKNFNSIIAAQYTMDFDPAKLEYIDMGNFNLPNLIASNFGVFPDEHLTFSWLDNNLQGVSLPDSTVIYSLWFKVLHPEGTTSTFSFENDPTVVEVVQLLPSGDHTLTPGFINGQVYAEANNPGLDLPSIDAICASILGCNANNSSFIDIDVSGGTPPYAFLWTNDAGESFEVEDLANVQQGVYHLTVTDQNDVQASAMVPLFDNSLNQFDVQLDLTAPDCGQANGAIELVLSNPAEFTIDWIDFDNNGTILSNLSAGTYEVVITENSTGCQQTKIINLTEATFLTGISYQCEIFGDSVNITLTAVVWPGGGGTAPYTFEWSDGSVQVDTFISSTTVIGSISTPQSYNVTITDANGCAQVSSFIEPNCSLSGNAVTIGASSASAAVGASFCVDVMVYDFTDILSMQFSMQWNPATIRFDSVNNYNLPTGTANNFGDPSILGPGVLTFAWLDNNLDGVTLPDGSTIFQLCFTALASGSTGISFTNTPTLIEVIDVNQDEVSLNSTLNDITVTGGINDDVSFQTQAPTCGQSNGTIELIISNPGDYSYAWSTGETSQSIANLSPGQYQVTITETSSGSQSIHIIDLEQTSLDPAVSYECTHYTDGTVDINLHVLIWSDERAPYTFTWSDGTVQTDSLLSTITVSSEIGASPSYSVTVTDATGCTYEPVVIEPDCNNNPDGLSLSASEASAEVGETVCLDISANGFEDIASLQFSMNWDASKLQYESIQGLNLPDLTLNNFNAEAELLDGTLRFSWLENTTQGITISDNTVLFQLCLTAIDGPANVPVNFGNDPVIMEATNGDLDILNISSHSGLVSISGGNGNGDEAVQLIIGEDLGIPGQEVCLPVTSENFTNVVSMQFSINWDPSIIEYSDIIFGDLPALSLSNFGILGTDDGELRMSWLDQSTSGVTMPDGATLFTICFIPVGPPGVSVIEFSNDPIPIEVIDVQTNELDFLGSAGQITVPTNLVWPGDTDQSEAVNHFDLLNIGLAFGSTGSVRENASTNWMAQHTAEWDGETPETGINFKHADTDGNGIVDANDTLALIQNWGEITDFWNGEEDQFGPPTASLLMDVPIYILPDTIIPGATVDFSIMLGNNDIPANDIYGLAFTIVYDPEVIVENSVGAHFMQSWMGDVNSNLLGIYRDNYASNKVDIAITRTDLSNVSGQGMIGSLQVTIEDVIFRRNNQYELRFEIENVRLIDAQEQEIPISPERSDIIIQEETTGIQAPEWAHAITVFPIPAKNQLNIDAGGLQIEGLNLYSIQGKRMRQFDPQQNSMNISNLPNGVYLLEIITEQGVVSRRVEKQ